MNAVEEDCNLWGEKPELNAESLSQPRRRNGMEVSRVELDTEEEIHEIGSQTPLAELNTEREMYEIDSRALRAEAPTEVANELVVAKHHPAIRRGL